MQTYKCKSFNDLFAIKLEIVKSFFFCVILFQIRLNLNNLPEHKMYAIIISCIFHRFHSILCFDCFKLQMKICELIIFQITYKHIIITRLMDGKFEYYKIIKCTVFKLFSAYFISLKIFMIYLGFFRAYLSSFWYNLLR